MKLTQKFRPVLINQSILIWHFKISKYFSTCSTKKAKLIHSNINMAKPKLLITRDDFPRVPLYDDIKEMFEVYEWPSTYKGRLPREEFKRLLKGCAAAMIVPYNAFDLEILDECCENLKVIGTYSVGFDHLPLEELRRRGIRAGNVGDCQTEYVAEYNIGLAIAAGRLFQQRYKFVVSGEWARKQTTGITECGYSLRDSTVGIIGLGKIGLETARLLKAFNVVKIVYTSRDIKPEGSKLGAERVSLNELLSQSDFIFLTCSLTKETENLIGVKEFALMKPTAVFINTGRGKLVDQNALVEVLQKNKITGAALDVMTPEPLPGDHPLTKLDNCIIQPHNSSAVQTIRTKMSTITLQNIISGYKGGDMVSEL